MEITIKSAGRDIKVDASKVRSIMADHGGRIEVQLIDETLYGDEVVFPESETRNAV